MSGKIRMLMDGSEQAPLEAGEPQAGPHPQEPAQVQRENDSLRARVRHLEGVIIGMEAESRAMRVAYNNVVDARNFHERQRDAAQAAHSTMVGAMGLLLAIMGMALAFSVTKCAMLQEEVGAAKAAPQAPVVEPVPVMVMPPPPPEDPWLHTDGATP